MNDEIALEIEPLSDYRDDEPALVAALRAGDERAYERMVAAHGGRMLAGARGILRNDEEARDALQCAVLRTCVRAAIDRLPESYRTVLVLRDIEELDTAEVATLLGVSANAVKVRLHRARQALRELLDPRMKRGFA